MTIDFSSTIQNSIKSTLDNINTSIPGIIEKYDFEKKIAAVLPSINLITPTGKILAMPILNSVPVIFQGSADSVIHFPLKKGDKVLLIFSQKSLETWLAGDGSVSDPGDPRQFALSDAYCIPGLFTPKSPGKVVTGEGMEILHKDSMINLLDDGKIEIKNTEAAVNLWTDGKVEVKNADASVNLLASGNVEVKNSSADLILTSGGDIELNGNSKNFVTHTELNTALQSFLTALNLHTHPTAATGPPSPPTAPLSLDISAAKTSTIKTGG